VKLLVVEDEPRIAAFLAKGLRAHGYEVGWASTGQQALRLCGQPGLSLVILDLKLPDLDGLEVLAGLRARGATVPVLILSARRRVGDRVRGLDLGADDYLAKPFAFEELLARIRARLRPGSAVAASLLRVGDLCLDLQARLVTVGGRKVNLSAREFALLLTFAKHPGQTLSRQQLLSTAWRIDFDPQTNLVDVYVGYLRRKLGEPVIETIRGAGYRLRTDRRIASPTQAEHRIRQVAPLPHGTVR
jgi:two-component system, OmpR family, response regulator